MKFEIRQTLPRIMDRGQQVMVIARYYLTGVLKKLIKPQKLQMF